MSTLTVVEIGAPDRTVTTEHSDYYAALTALVERYGSGDTLRHRDKHNGTVGYVNGRVFQASKVWRID